MKVDSAVVLIIACLVCGGILGYLVGAFPAKEALDREYNRGYGDALYWVLQQQRSEYFIMKDFVNPAVSTVYRNRTYAVVPNSNLTTSYIQENATLERIYQNKSLMCDEMGTGHMKCWEYPPPAHLCNCTGGIFNGMDDLVAHCTECGS